MKYTQVIIGLGSSQGEKKNFLDKACKEMKVLGKNFRVSSYLETDPWGGVATEKFLNAVAVFETKLLPLELLDALQKIENNNGRMRTTKWDDRTLDLDILYYGDETIDIPRLKIPHPLIEARDFVKIPLLELMGEKFISQDLNTDQYESD